MKKTPALLVLVMVAAAGLGARTSAEGHVRVTVRDAEARADRRCADLSVSVNLGGWWEFTLAVTGARDADGHVLELHQEFMPGAPARPHAPAPVKTRR